MSDRKKGPPIPPSGPSLEDEDSPVSEPRPSSPSARVSFDDDREPDNDDGEPIAPDDPPIPDSGEPANDDAGAIRVTRALTNAFLAKKATQARIRQIVEFRSQGSLQAADIENVIQDANVRAMTTTRLARSVEGMWPWISTITLHAFIDFRRANKKRLKWLRPEIDVQELPPNPMDEGGEAEQAPDDPTAPPRPVHEMSQASLHRWLRETVETTADVTTLDMIEQKAATGQTNAEIASEFGISEDAYDARLRRFSEKWIPRWEKYKRDRSLTVMVLALLFAAVVAALWWLLGGAKKVEPIGPTDVPVLRPVPTASVVLPEPERFNQAAPTDAGRPDKP